MKIYDRAAGQYCEEREYGWKSLKFLYGTAAGRVLLKIFFCRGIYRSEEHTSELQSH